MNNLILKEIQSIKKYVKDKEKLRSYANNISVKDCIAPIYHKLHDDIMNNKHMYYNLPGGRGSGKSSFCAIEIVFGIMQDLEGRTNAIVFRKVASTLRESVFNQIMWAIDELNVNHLWKSTLNPMQLIYIPTGARIVFRGLDKAIKLKSIKPQKGYFKFIWFEEFAELEGSNFVRNILQSVLRGGDTFIVFNSFNPPLSKNNWANKYIELPDKRSVTLKTSYLDVPKNWLGENFIIDAERLKALNYKAYQNEYLGIAIGSGGEVFPNLEIREITEEEIKQMQYIYCGIDFGFSTDPCAFIRLAYNKKTEQIYLLDEIYKHHLSNVELAEIIKSKKYDYETPYNEYYSIFSDSFIHDKQTIVCDAAEPKSIADLKKHDIKAIACKKYPGSVKYGIKWLQRRKIIIDAKRTPNAYKEFINYEYMTTKDGEFLAEVPDKDNHLIDATRYSLDRLINSSKENA